MGKHPGGRPRIILDEEQVLKCAEKQWTNTEIAAFFRVSVDTVERRFAEEIKQARQSGRAKLKDLQWKRALEGSDTMIRHMSEHYLGQHQRQRLDLSQVPDELLIPEIEKRLTDGSE